MATHPLAAALQPLEGPFQPLEAALGALVPVTAFGKTSAAHPDCPAPVGYWLGIPVAAGDAMSVAEGYTDAQVRPIVLVLAGHWTWTCHSRHTPHPLVGTEGDALCHRWSWYSAQSRGYPVSEKLPLMRAKPQVALAGDAVVQPSILVCPLVVATTALPRHFDD